LKVNKNDFSIGKIRPQSVIAVAEEFLS
jgi:hypothetical protein